MTDRITFCEDEPGVIDEIVHRSVDVHIERMDDGTYWMEIDGRVYWAHAVKRGHMTIKPSEEFPEREALAGAVMDC